jgi:hypothetical protein
MSALAGCSILLGVVLTPGMAGTIPKLQQAGFHYAK